MRPALSDHTFFFQHGDVESSTWGKSSKSSTWVHVELFFSCRTFGKKFDMREKSSTWKVRHELFGPARQGRTNFENISLVLLQKLFKLDSKLHLSDKNFGSCGGHFFTGRGRWSQLPRRAFLGRPLNYREVKRILFRHDTIVHTTQSDIFTCRDVLLCAGNIVEPTILFCLCQSRPNHWVSFLTQ